MIIYISQLIKFDNKTEFFIDKLFMKLDSSMIKILLKTHVSLAGKDI